MFTFKKKSLAERHLKQLSREIDPDEIFLDAENLPKFDKTQFEGRIEKPLGKGVVFGVAAVFILVEVFFFAQVTNLQVIKGEELFHKSENNRLNNTPSFAMRGAINDRNKVPLAWNSFEKEKEISDNNLVLPRRSYIESPGFGHILGYVSYPKRDNNGYFYQKEFLGKDGVEEHYQSVLAGKDGLNIVETDALGNVQSGNIVESPQDGATLDLCIDARVQEKLFSIISETAQNYGYMAGAGVLMDVHNGEVITMVSYPEYRSSVLTDGTDKKTIQNYQVDKRSVFLDRAVSGLYTPGSIIKPIMAIAALSEGVITPEKEILSTGSISIQNPYFPSIKSVFNDWKAHGWVDMRRAIAVSSDVYFYVIGGGYQGDKGMGIENIEKYSRMFGFGSPTGIDLGDEKSGIIPSPAWKAEMFKGDDWRIGDTYHTVIGQYGFQTTLIQVVRAIAGVSNNGVMVTPHIACAPRPESPQVIISLPVEYFKVAREGMRDAVRSGTVTGLNVSYMDVAGKTGTAELGSAKKFINSWVVGFFPYEKPEYAFAVVMERGPYENSIGGVFVIRQLLDWMHINTPEYFK